MFEFKSKSGVMVNSDDFKPKFVLEILVDCEAFMDAKILNSEEEFYKIVGKNLIEIGGLG